MKKLYLLTALGILSSCAVKKQADLIVYNANVYTVDRKFSTAEAFAVKEGKILETGSSKNIRKRYLAAEQLNAEGKAIYPGFIDGHSHFYAYGEGLQTLDLVGTGSWDEIIEKVKAFAVQNPEGWILGRGWDQNDWAIKEYPNNQKLNELFPGRPVLLSRIDGHAAIVNQAALTQAGVKAGQILTGGEVETESGRLTGILIDNAVDLVSSKVPPATQINGASLFLMRKKIVLP